MYFDAKAVSVSSSFAATPVTGWGTPLRYHVLPPNSVVYAGWDGISLIMVDAYFTPAYHVVVDSASNPSPR